ncbi:MAG TPA: 3-methyl-2-oxobutanoate hydroxymethyltransferase [Sphingobacteriaceae bacterium]|nr:3-methyl-2-oxobutanoate hydroxymethyltransferase [Sphingobacteriaceae bacterium]
MQAGEAKPTQGTDGALQEKVTVPGIRAMKGRTRITVLTAYDAITARLVDQAGVDIILVGDSLGMVVLGYDTTLPVTMEDMIHHTRAVRRGVKRALVVADMPFGSFQGSVDRAVDNGVRLLKEGRADAVKLEGGRRVAEAVERMVEMGIPVMGHVGLTPQSVKEFGGFKVQGREEAERRRLLNDVQSLAEAGVFSIVIEGVPAALAAELTAAAPVPTIGIGAGPQCDGQVLVLHDMLGMVQDFKPKFVKRYADVAGIAIDAVRRYCDEVRRGEFPGEEHLYD